MWCRRGEARLRCCLELERAIVAGGIILLGVQGGPRAVVSGWARPEPGTGNSGGYIAAGPGRGGGGDDEDSGRGEAGESSFGVVVGRSGRPW